MYHDYSNSYVYVAFSWLYCYRYVTWSLLFLNGDVTSRQRHKSERITIRNSCHLINVARNFNFWNIDLLNCPRLTKNCFKVFNEKLFNNSNNYLKKAIKVQIYKFDRLNISCDILKQNIINKLLSRKIIARRVLR